MKIYLLTSSFIKKIFGHNLPTVMIFNINFNRFDRFKNNTDNLLDYESIELTVDELIQPNFVLVFKLFKKLNLKLPRELLIYLFEFI